MSIRLYVGNLPEDLSRQELEAVFAEEGDAVSTKIITDRKTGKCRGFGFVTVKTDEMADQLIEKFNGFALKDTAIKLEKALPRAKEKDEDETPEVVAVSSPNVGKQRVKSNGGNSTKANRSPASSSDESVQPDPRWAQDLEKLKQLLAAQTTNS